MDAEEAQDPVSIDCDNEFLVAGPGGPYVARFLDELSRSWPDMLICVNGGSGWLLDGGVADAHPWNTARDMLTPISGSVFVDRDAAMKSFSDEWAYALDDDGEGPIYLTWGPFPASTFKVTIEENPRRETACAWEPMALVAAGAGLSYIDAVTPDTDAPFVQDLLARLVVSLNRPLQLQGMWRRV